MLAALRNTVFANELVPSLHVPATHKTFIRRPENLDGRDPLLAQPSALGRPRLRRSATHQPEWKLLCPTLVRPGGRLSRADLDASLTLLRPRSAGKGRYLPRSNRCQRGRCSIGATRCYGAKNGPKNGLKSSVAVAVL